MSSFTDLFEEVVLEAKVSKTVDKFQAAVEKELQKQGYDSMEDIADIPEFMKSISFKLSSSEEADLSKSV